MKVHFSTFAFSYAFEIRDVSYLLHPKNRKNPTNFISETLKQLVAEFDEQHGHELLMKLAYSRSEVNRIHIVIKMQSLHCF